MLRHLVTFSWPNTVCIVVGAVWAWLAPTVPWILLCTAAVVLDCISAIRLNRRVRRKYGPKAADGKIKSQHMFRMLDDLFVVYGTILIGYGVNTIIFPDIPLPIAEMIAGIFSIIELCSILENESSCSDRLWAKAMQKWVVDKTKRHLEVDLSSLRDEENHGESEDTDTDEERFI